MEYQGFMSQVGSNPSGGSSCQYQDLWHMGDWATSDIGISTPACIIGWGCHLKVMMEGYYNRYYYSTTEVAITRKRNNTAGSIGPKLHGFLVVRLMQKFSFLGAYDNGFRINRRGIYQAIVMFVMTNRIKPLVLSFLR